MDDLEVFAPVPRKITVAGREFAILPLRMRQIPQFMQAVSPVVGLILAQAYVQAATEQAEAVQEAVAIATGASPEFLADLFPNQFLALASAVFEVNIDFFARQVLPAWTETLMILLEAVMPQAGLTSLPGSGGAATVSTPALI